MKSTSDTYIPEEIMSFSDLKLFALSSNKELAERVAQEIGIELGNQVFANFQMERFRSTLKNQSVGNTSLSYNQLVRL